MQLYQPRARCPSCVAPARAGRHAGYRLSSDILFIGGLVQMARKQRAERWAEHRRQCDEDERQSRVMIIAEFDAARGDDARPSQRDPEVPPGREAACKGDRLGGHRRALRADRPRSSLASEAHR